MVASGEIPFVKRPSDWQTRSARRRPPRRDAAWTMTRSNRSSSQTGPLAITLLVALGLAACRPKPASTAPAATTQAARAVQVTQARLVPVERIVKSFGSLSAYEQATLSTEVAGRIETIDVDLGAVVRAGDRIAQIDPRDHQLHWQQATALLAQARVRLGLPLDGEDDSITLEETSVVRQTRALLEEARAHRDRVRNLAAQRILSASEVEAAEAAHEVAVNKHEDSLQDVRTRQALVAQRRAEAELARKQLEATTLRAPFDGMIQERRANVGEYVSASTPVVTLVRVDPLRLRLEVSERESPKIAPGQQVRLYLPGTDHPHLGAIQRLSPALDEQSRMLRIEADVPNDGTLRPGSFVTAEIVINQRDPAVVIPADAIVTFAGVEKVFVIESGKAMERSIVSGQRLGGDIEVVRGLKDGETVVLRPGNLRTGQDVAIGDS